MICTKCNISKNIQEYYKNMKQCKSCTLTVNKAYREKNKEKVADYQKQWAEKNKEIVASRSKKYAEGNREYIATYKKEYYHKNIDKIQEYRKGNKARINAHTAKRRAAKLQRTPHWLTEANFQEIADYYTLAQTLTEFTGVVHVVDHIHPLQGKNICGLHVPSNLQVITATENNRKYNKS